jgi:hypothetical protein
MCPLRCVFSGPQRLDVLCLNDNFEVAAWPDIEVHRFIAFRRLLDGLVNRD